MLTLAAILICAGGFGLAFRPMRERAAGLRSERMIFEAFTGECSAYGKGNKR